MFKYWWLISIDSNFTKDCIRTQNGDFNDVMNEVESMLSASTNMGSLSLLSGVTTSIDLRLNEADQLYNDCKFKQCFKIVNEYVYV